MKIHTYQNNLHPQQISFSKNILLSCMQVLPPAHSPSGRGSSAVSLNGHSRPTDPRVSDPRQPPSDPALDDHGGHAQPLGPQPLQESHLTGPEEHFGLSEAVLVRVRDEPRQRLSARGPGVLLTPQASEQEAVSAEELLVRPPGIKEKWLPSKDGLHFFLLVNYLISIVFA